MRVLEVFEGFGSHLGFPSVENGKALKSRTLHGAETSSEGLKTYLTRQIYNMACLVQTAINQTIK